MSRTIVSRGGARTAAALAIGSAFLLSACAGGSDAGANVVAYEGARVIPGDGSGPIDDAVFLVENGRFTAVGPRSEVDVPSGATRVDLAGRTVIPALVNAHVHLSSDRAERLEQARHYAYYGQGTLASLGLDEGTIGYEMRDELVPGAARTLTAGPGITSPEPGRSEVPFWVTTEEEARAAVRQMAADGVDLVKIWVDDRGGQYERLPPELYGPVIEEAHAHDLKVAAHIFRLEDAKGLLRAGLDGFAHGIRDMDVDDELLQLWSERPQTTLIPNLPGPGVPADLSWIGTVPADELAAMQAREVERPEQQASFGIQARNLARIAEAGFPVAFGTDGSSAWAAHLEIEDMVRSGLSPTEAIVAATSTSAEFLELGDEVGRVAPGLSADFVVLEADPLQDITNTRRIVDVYLRGEAVDREAVAASLTQAAAQE